MFYRKIENGKEQSISEQEFRLCKPSEKQLILRSSDQGKEVLFFNEKSILINPVEFYTLIGILTAKKFRTYRELKEIATDGSGQEISDDYIRKLISRLSRELPFWEVIIETTSILNLDTRRNVSGIRLREDFLVCILCRTEDYLPI